MIQGSINQLLLSAAIFGRLAPGYEQKVEARQATKQIKSLEDLLSEVGKHGILTDVEGTAGSNIANELLSEKSKASGRLFKASPSKETFLSYQRARSEAGEPIMKMTDNDYDDDFQQLNAEKAAKKSLTREQNRVMKSKRNFMDYLGKLETSLGGTVSQLPPEMQKQIASQYSKSQRQTLMDRMDKEAKNK